MVRARLLLASLLALALAACGSKEGPVEVAFIDTPESLFSGGIRLSPGAQHLRAATHAGLVGLNAQGEVVPALADRWIVTDDGRSFIFRLRDGSWPDGTELTAESVRAALRRTIAALRGTSLGLDLAPIAEVRAMAGRVVEIRLTSPVPTLLQLLAQPELVLTNGEGASGDMTLAAPSAECLQRPDRAGCEAAVLVMKPPLERALPQESDWQAYVRELRLRAASAEDAVALFGNGEVDVVLGGQLGALPLVDTGPLSRGTVRLDPAIGLFGLQVRRASGLLASEEGREAIAMTINRPALLAPYNVGGWVPTTRIVAPGLPDDPGFVEERWRGRTIEERRAVAAGRVAAWRRANEGAEARLTLAIDRTPGLEALYAELARQLATIGVRLERVEPGQPADFTLVDRVARYAEPRWFLNQFNCALGNGMCSNEADLLVREAVAQPDRVTRDSLLAQAEAELMRANVYIPLSSPLRFSLVRSDVDGFEANAWAFHPLPPLAVIPR